MQYTYLSLFRLLGYFSKNPDRVAKGPFFGKKAAHRTRKRLIIHPEHVAILIWYFDKIKVFESLYDLHKKISFWVWPN